MADTKISAFSAATDLVGATVPIVQAGVNKKAAASLFSGTNSGIGVYNVTYYGAVHDGVIVRSNCAGNSGQAVLSNGTDSPFTAAMVGKVILISGAGTAGAPLKTTVLSFSSSSSITLATNILTTVTTAQAIIGTDDTSAIQSAINAAHTAGGGKVYFPNGIYIIDGALQTSIGGNNPNCQIYLPSEATTTYTENHIQLIGESAPAVPVYNSAVDYTGVVLLSTRISVSGTNPCVLGTIGVSGNYLDFNFSDAYLENIHIVVTTNKGANAPYISGINFYKAATVSAKKVSVTTEAGLYNTVTASGSSTFGFIASGINNNGPNTFEECTVQGFEYGFIPAEHTVMYNFYVLGCNHGFAIPRLGHTVTGKILAHECINQLLIPSGSTFLGMTNSGGYAFIDLFMETEVNTLSKWFDTTTLLSDTSNLSVGVLKFNASSPADTVTLLATVTNATELNIVPLKTILPRRFNQAGGNVTFHTGQGSGAAIIEANSALAGGTADNYAQFQAVTDQANTGTAPVGHYIVLNKNISGSERRMMLLGTYTNGANNTSIIYWYNLIAGALQEIAHIDKNFNFSIPPVLPSYANDAAADAASQGGTAPAGTLYYNTGSSKMKVKEGASWKTVTTS